MFSSSRSDGDSKGSELPGVSACVMSHSLYNKSVILEDLSVMFFVLVLVGKKDVELVCLSRDLVEGLAMVLI